MRGSWLWACAGLLAACGNDPPALPSPPPAEDLQIRVRKRPALAPLRDAPGLAGLGAPRPGTGDGKLHVHLLDVGHGDAALVISPTGRTVLVDVGPQEATAFLANRLAEQVTQPLDLLAITSARPEHAGGLDGVLRAASTDRLVLPAPDADGADGPAAKARARGVPVYAPGGAAGRPFTVDLGGGASLELHGPLGEPSAPCMVLRITHGRTAVLFPGDAPQQVESDLLRDGAALRSTVLRVGARGLATSTGQRWLTAVQPSAAVLSFGPGNEDGAPSPEVLDRLREARVATWRTDLDGEVHLESDGEQLMLAVERPAAGEPVGVRNRYAPGQPPGRIAPTGAPLTGAAPARAAPAPPVATTPPQPKDDLALPANWGKPAVAAAGPAPATAPAPRGKPSPTPAQQDDLAMPANWGKPAVAAGTPAPAPRGKPAPAPAQQDDLALPANWGKPSAGSPPAPAPTAAKQQPAPRAAAASSSGGYAASKASRKFHTAACDAVRKIKPENLVTFKTREEAASGREPAKDCNP